MQRGNLSESEEFFLLEMFFSSNTIGNAFQYHFFFLPTLAQLQTYIVLWGEDSLGSCAIYFCIRFWSNQMNSVGESVHMNTLLTCELRHLLWPQYGEVP